MNEALAFTPWLRPMVWGDRRLETLLHRPLPEPVPYGESWEVSDHALHRSVVAQGPHTGRTLRDLMKSARDDLVGTGAHDIFPWLIKFIDAHDWLSVQVHPDAEVVRKLRPGEGSKTEAWYVLEAAPASRIYAGLLPGVDERALRAALAAGRVVECLHSFTPQSGDCVFLPAGTVHAVGGGVLLAEVQETSDATFRLYDWNRRTSAGQTRPLHVEEALASIHWEQGPIEPIRVADYPDALQTLVRCPFFELDYQQAIIPFPLGGAGRLQALIVVRGQAALHGERGSDAVGCGDVRVLPAALPPVQVVPHGDLGALVCTLPFSSGP